LLTSPPLPDRHRPLGRPIPRNQ